MTNTCTNALWLMSNVFILWSFHKYMQKINNLPSIKNMLVLQIMMQCAEKRKHYCFHILDQNRKNDNSFENNGNKFDRFEYWVTLLYNFCLFEEIILINWTVINRECKYKVIWVIVNCTRRFDCSSDKVNDHIKLHKRRDGVCFSPFVP